MNFSHTSREQMDSCRFCWMCRHICPIGNATGQERNTARARALGLSLAARDAVEFSGDIIDNVYECSLCGACTKECVTGWDPEIFIKEARKIAAMDNKLPDYIEKLLDKYENSGNIYGKELSPVLADKIKTLKKADTLFFIGSDARYNNPENAAESIELLEKIGIPFTVLENEPDSGYAMNFMVGAVEETREIAENTAKALDFKTVICYDSNDAAMFMREYKEWGIDMKAEIVTFTSFLAENIGKLAIKPNGVYTIQDPPSLARDLEETEPLRVIINALGENREMLLNRRDTMLAGNLIMNEYMGEVMEHVAADRWINARNMNAKTVVTANPAEYVMLKKTKPEDIELLTVEEAVLKCL